MNVRTVRAILHFRTPFGELSKCVNWSYYESRALLTTSTSAYEAFNRFLINTQTIINASKRELQYLETICFYDEVKRAKGSILKKNHTKTIKIEENMELKVLEQ